MTDPEIYTKSKYIDLHIHTYNVTRITSALASINAYTANCKSIKIQILYVVLYIKVSTSLRRVRSSIFSLLRKSTMEVMMI